jgi:hypothetical protein
MSRTRTALRAPLLLGIFLCFGCSKDSVSPESSGQIVLQISFGERTPGASRAAGVDAIDRVFVTVRPFEYRDTQEPVFGEVILRQSLSIVSRLGRRFAEGSLTVPLKRESSLFEVRVDAFEGSTLTHRGVGIAYFDWNENRAFVNLELISLD